jgi:hypothetical protein
MLSNLLVELSVVEQELLSGGCYQAPSTTCCKPKKCGRDYPKYDQSMPYSSEDNNPEPNDKCSN